MSKIKFLKNLNLLEQIIKSDPSKKTQQGFRTLLTEQENYFDTHRYDRTEFSEGEVTSLSTRLSALRSEMQTPLSSSASHAEAHYIPSGSDEGHLAAAKPAPGVANYTHQNLESIASLTAAAGISGRTSEPDNDWEFIYHNNI